jgi:hypothetical protein
MKKDQSNNTQRFFFWRLALLHARKTGDTKKLANFIRETVMRFRGREKQDLQLILEDVAAAFESDVFRLEKMRVTKRSVRNLYYAVLSFRKISSQGAAVIDSKTGLPTIERVSKNRALELAARQHDVDLHTLGEAVRGSHNSLNHLLKKHPKLKAELDTFRQN